MRQPAGNRNRVRIIAGSHRGRIIHFPDAEGLRPTADRIRETLFNWLQPVMDGAQCLDLFAGSGALGFEAASRGAGSVRMIENNPRVAVALERNANALGLSQVEVARADALQWMGRHTCSFDVIFADPPFALRLLPQVLESIVERNLLRPQGALYMESDAADPLPPLPSDWNWRHEKRSGQVLYGLAYWQP